MNAKEAAIKEELIDVLGLALQKRLDDWTAKRTASGVEQRWREDTLQYNGLDAGSVGPDILARAQGAAAPKAEAATQRSTVYVNVTRPKSNAAEARLANMLIPSDDRNFAIKPTPKPTLSKIAKEVALGLEMVGGFPMLEQTYGFGLEQTAAPAGLPSPPMGQAPPPQMPMAGMPPGQMPMPPGQGQLPPPPGQPAAPTVSPEAAAAQAELAKIREAATGMQDEIDDKLAESNWNAEVRSMLHDCTTLGTGILKGPVVTKRVNKVWAPHEANPSVWVMQTAYETTVASKRVSPWNVFPDPSCGNNIHDGAGIFELTLLNKKQVRDLARQPGYLPEQIKKVLAEDPDTPKANNLREADDPYRNSLELYECWEFWGELDPDDLQACGVDVESNTLETLSGCVIMINGHVVKAFVNPLESGGLPYDFMVWEPMDNSPWGLGIPYLCRPAQRVLNAAWRQVMDNSALSVGPNVVIKRGIVEPANGKWELTGRKIWYCTDATQNVAEAFSFFDIPNNSQQFQSIIELALQFIDAETGIPAPAQGEASPNVETVGGMSMLMNSANVVLTRLAKAFDDSIINSHIRRYYDYLMEHSPKQEIKGDFQIEPRGSSALLVKDQQAQAMLALGQFQGSPMIAGIINWDKWFEQILRLQHIEPGGIMKSAEEITQIQNAPPQPDGNQMRAEATVKAAQIRAQADVQRSQIETQGEHVYAQIEMKNRELEHQARMVELNMKRELALLDYANQNRLSLEQVKAKLAQTALVEDTKRQVAAAKLQAERDIKERDLTLQRETKALDHDQTERQFAAQHNASVRQSERDHAKSREEADRDFMKSLMESERNHTFEREKDSAERTTRLSQHEREMSLAEREQRDAARLAKDKLKAENERAKRDANAQAKTKPTPKRK